MEDGNIAAIDLSGPALSFGNTHPLVFLNACETGQRGLSLTHLGGWAERFTEAGCGAFIGTLWAVEDDAAQDFARVFYEEICRGATLGDACSHARSKIRSETSASWLAYSLYADPQAVLILPKTTPPMDETAETSKVKRSPEELTPRETPVLDVNRYGSDIAKAFQKSIDRASALGAGFVDSLLFFEALCAIPNGAIAQAFQRLGINSEEITLLLRKVNDNRYAQRQDVHPTDKVGVSKSTLEILKLAGHLAAQAGRKQAQDVDVLEAFILHNHNSVTTMLMDADVQPHLLLHRAFQVSGELNQQCFSAVSQSILAEVLRLSHGSRLVGSPQFLAALVASKSGLARQLLQVPEGSLDAYVRARLDATILHPERPVLQVVSLETCSTRAICILNLAELLARAEGSLVVEEKHLIEAYIATE